MSQKRAFNNKTNFKVTEDRTTASIIKSKDTNQYMRKDFSVLKARFKPFRSAGISTILIPEETIKGETVVKIVNNPPEVEAKIIERNKKLFGQSERAPFTKVNIIEAWGYQGVSEQSEQLIEGKDMTSLIASLEGTGKKEILRTLNDGNNLSKINTDISLASFMQGFLKWREAT